MLQSTLSTALAEGAIKLEISTLSALGTYSLLDVVDQGLASIIYYPGFPAQIKTAVTAGKEAVLAANRAVGQLDGPVWDHECFPAGAAWLASAPSLRTSRSNCSPDPHHSPQWRSNPEGPIGSASSSQSRSIPRRHSGRNTRHAQSPCHACPHHQAMRHPTHADRGRCGVRWDGQR